MLREQDGWLEIQSPAAAQPVRLYCREWLPAGAPRAKLLLAHGLAEHSGRYEHVARFFAGHGFSLHAIDHEGHGKSAGTPGFVASFQHYLDGLSALLDHARRDGDAVPLFLVGHSMGGLIAALFLLGHQQAFAGCVLSGPLVKSDAEPPRLVLLVNRLLSKILPRLGVLRLDATAVSRDPVVVERYLSDPLVFNGKVTTRLVNELFVATRRLVAEAGAIRIPLLLLHGESDRLTSPEGSKLLHGLVSSTDKTLKHYPGLYHEIFNEPEQVEVLTDVLAWLQRHLPGDASID